MTTTEPGSETVWNEWGPTVRVRVEASGVMILARTLTDESPIYTSETAAEAAGFSSIPAPPTFTFVMAHSGTFPDLQPADGTGSLYGASAGPTAAFSRKGLYLHGEQHFTYHRQPLVGDVLEGRMRTSQPVVRQARRGPMEVTFFQTEWRDLDGTPAVTEQIVSLFFPE
jgi:hypothetical protein